MGSFMIHKNILINHLRKSVGNKKVNLTKSILYTKQFVLL